MRLSFCVPVGSNNCFVRIHELGTERMSNKFCTFNIKLFQNRYLGLSKPHLEIIAYLPVQFGMPNETLKLKLI